jgi:hypothetical protein
MYYVCIYGKHTVSGMWRYVALYIYVPTYWKNFSLHPEGRWSQRVPPKRQYIFIRLHGATSQKTVFTARLLHLTLSSKHYIPTLCIFSSYNNSSPLSFGPLLYPTQFK